MFDLSMKCTYAVFDDAISINRSIIID